MDAITVSISIGALGGSDFTSLTTTQNFTASHRRVCVNISINYDYILNEGIENFKVDLAAGQNLPQYVHLTPSRTTVQIYNIIIIQ